LWYNIDKEVNMKRYYAEGSFRNNHPVLVESEKDGKGMVSMLRHNKEYSPDGHSWGYGGSGPHELAKDLLWDVFDVRPSNDVCNAFMRDVIANIPQDKGWSLSETTIRGWVRRFELVKPVERG
jgi:hypothetical protein